MRYAYHFEFCERPELPEWLRGDLFESLAFVQSAFGLKKILAGTVPQVAQECGASRLIELGSGSGDGLSAVACALPGMCVVATDKFPRADFWQAKLRPCGNASWVERPVCFEDFEKVLTPEQLRGAALLLVSAFHHMAPQEARAFVERAAAAGVSLIVVEPLARNTRSLFLGGLCGIPAFFAPIVQPPERALSASAFAFAKWVRRLVLHALLPVVPLILSHDGVVSAFRQRKRGDWRMLIQDLPFELQVREKLGLLGNFSVVVLQHKQVMAHGV